VGLAPTGAKDPFGLRRAAIGVVQALLEHDRELDLGKALGKAAELQPVRAGARTQDEVLSFIAGRLSVVLKDTGYRYDVVEAVLAEQSRNPASAGRAAKQLQAWVQKENWGTMLPAFARCVRITRGQKKTFTVDPKVLVEQEEKDLLRQIKRAEAALRLAALPTPDAMLDAFIPMIPAINAFFDKVLVMDKKKVLRENRLGLLQRISALSHGVADLSQLEGF
jgi:glycyl-tRNA synthetase